MGGQPSREVLFQQSSASVQVSEGVVRDLIRHHQAINRPGGRPAEQFKDEEDLRQAYDELYSKYQQASSSARDAHNQGFQQGLALQRHEKERELMQLDMHWQKRVDDLQQKREEQTTQDFNTVLSDFKNRFRMEIPQPKCQQQQRLVFDCLRNNPSKPLNCSEEAKQFLACADRARSAYLGKIEQ
eukprot:m.180281 g.180281  ORF g.180281 m.180281 type:complete len:185 (-) comp16612_c1_seq1:242-796(-)